MKPSPRRTGHERRSAPRYEHESAAELVRLDDRGEPTADWWQVHLRDLSSRGVQILVTQPLEVGSRVVLALAPHLAEPIIRLAVVRRVIERQERWTTVGVQFQPWKQVTPRPWAEWTNPTVARARLDAA